MQTKVSKRDGNPGLDLPAQDRKTIKLANEFSKVLREWLTAKEIRKVILRNHKANYSKDVCHSHDFCDANQAMLDAYQTVFKHEPKLSNEGTIYRLNVAWSLAKGNDFKPFKSDQNSNDITVETTMQGYRCSAIVDNQRVTLHYICYPEQEAIKRFKKYLKTLTTAK